MSKKMLTLKSSDGETFDVEEHVILQSQTIKHIIEDDCTTDNAIPVPSVTGSILSKVIEYCKKHADKNEELKTWDTSFINVDMDVLYDLIMAANYLSIASLLDLCCQTVADMIKGKTVDEIQNKFNIKNAFTPAEEAEIFKENQWALE